MLFKADGASLKVALVHDHLNQKGGAELVLKVLSEIFPQAPIFTVVYDEQKIGDWFPAERVRPSFLQNWPGSKKYLKLYLPLIKFAVEALDLRGYDIIISSASGLIKGLLVPQKSIHICYCHTPPRYLWSETQMYFERLRVPNFIKRLGLAYVGHLRTWDYQAAQRVDVYFANSTTVKQRISKYYHRDSTVIFPPVPVEESWLQTFKAPKSHFVLVSRLEPYKRLDIAIQAFNRLRLPLIIIGQGSDEARLKAMAKSNITFTGYIPYEAKQEIIASAQAFIHPHPEEDFGMSLVEAFAVGCPVIAHRSGGPLETMIEGRTGEFFNDLAWEDLAGVVLNFKTEKYDREFIRSRSRIFSRTNFVTTLLQRINEILQSQYKSTTHVNDYSDK